MEGPSVVEFPDESTVRIITGDDTISNPKKDFEFDRVYGPHIGQGERMCVPPISSSPTCVFPRFFI